MQTSFQGFFSPQQLLSFDFSHQRRDAFTAPMLKQSDCDNTNWCRFFDINFQSDCDGAMSSSRISHAYHRVKLADDL